jgi:hypothetical protein
MKQRTPHFLIKRRVNAPALPAGWRYAEPSDALWVDSVLAIGGRLIFGVFRSLNKSLIHYVGHPVITLSGQYAQVALKRKNYNVYQDPTFESSSQAELDPANLSK